MKHYFNRMVEAYFYPIIVVDYFNKCSILRRKPDCHDEGVDLKMQAVLKAEMSLNTFVFKLFKTLS